MLAAAARQTYLLTWNFPAERYLLKGQAIAARALAPAGIELGIPRSTIGCQSTDLSGGSILGPKRLVMAKQLSFVNTDVSLGIGDSIADALGLAAMLFED